MPIATVRVSSSNTKQYIVIRLAHNLLHSSWSTGRETISLDNSKPRMTLLNTYYAKPPKAGEDANEYR